MSDLTKYPLQDGYITTLSQSWNGAVGTVYVNDTPSFTFPSGVTTYITVNPGKTNQQAAIIDSYDPVLNTLNVTSIAVDKGAGVAYTQQTHQAGSTVIISDNYQFWEDIATSVSTKLDQDGGNGLAYADTAARDAALGGDGVATENYRMIKAGAIYYNYNLTLGQWQAVSTGTAPANASTTVAGIVEIATSAESIAGTDTGGTGAKLSVLPSDIAKNTQSSTFIYGEDVGGDDTYVFPLIPALTTYTTGQSLYGKVTTANTGACTGDFGPGPKNIKTLDGNDPQSGVVNGICHFIYDGTNLVLQRSDYSTSTNRGIVELATDAETIAGTSTTLAVTPASYKAAVTQALVGGDFNTQFQVYRYKSGTTSVLNASAGNNIDFSVAPVGTTPDGIGNYGWTGDGYIYNLLPGKPNTSNTNLRWDDIDTIELEFTADFDNPSTNRYLEVGLCDSSGTTGRTDFASTQRRILLSAGNATTASALIRTADGTTASSSSAITVTTTNWNTYKIVFDKTGGSVTTYVNGVLSNTKNTNLPAGTNNVVVGIGLESPGGIPHWLYLSPITVRVKYA